MSQQPEATEEDVVVAYAGGAGRLSPHDVDDEIKRVWSEKMATSEGRAEIAHALGVTPDEIASGPAPFATDKDTSGFMGVDIVVAAHWAAVNLLVPVLVGLAKDEIKARVAQLWREVIKPAIDGDDGEEKFGSERALPKD